MPVTEIELYETLKEQIGEKHAKTLLEYIQARTEKEFETKREILATKEDIANLEVKIEQIRLATKEDIANLEVKIEQIRLATKENIANLEVKIERVKADLIRWMFIFWAGQIGALIGILTLFFK